MNINDFYVADYKGLADVGSKFVPADATVRLDDVPCRFAFLSNWNIENSPSFSAKPDAGGGALVEDDREEMYYGFNGRIIDQIFPGRRTETFAISNLNQICVRCRPSNSGTIWVAWFW